MLVVVVVVVVFCLFVTWLSLLLFTQSGKPVSRFSLFIQQTESVSGDRGGRLEFSLAKAVIQSTNKL